MARVSITARNVNRRTLLTLVRKFVPSDPDITSDDETQAPECADAGDHDVPGGPGAGAEFVCQV